MALTQIADAGLKTPASDLQDNAKIVLGTGNDLEIYHDGSHSFIKDSGQGNLKVLGSNLSLKNTADDKAYIDCIDAGAVEIYHNGTKKLETTSAGVTVTGAILTTGNIDAGANNFLTDDDGIFSAGTSGDLQILHDGSASIIKHTHGSNDLYIQCDTNLHFTDVGANETFLKLVDDGAVELYHDNSKKLETQSGGVRVYGDLENHNDDFVAKDNCKFTAGNSADLEIYHDGSHSYINESGTGNLKIKSSRVDILNPAGDEDMIVAVENGEVELFYDGSKKFVTNAYGVKAVGHIYADDDHKVQLGSSQDLTLYHSGGHSYVNNAVGDLYIIQSVDQGNGIFLEPKPSEAGIKIFRDGAVECYYDNTKRFETSSTGVNIPGYLYVQRSSTVAKFDKSSSEDQDGIQMRHARGGLSGYTGKMISFRGNDDTEEGSIVIGTTDTAYNTSSDYRLKENQVAISNGITRIKQLKPYRFNWKKDDTKTVDGFFAHEVTPVVPEAIYGTKDAVDSDGNIIKQQIDQSRLVPLLTAALQEAIAKIETLETKVAALEAA